jgi:hypothetical protein
MNEKRLKEYLDNSLSSSLQGILERKAQQYKKYGMEKQAKRVRGFKKEVRSLVGTL